MGVIELNTAQMEKLIHASDVDMIVWAFRHGRYDVRKLAVDYFGANPSLRSIALLEEAIYDDTVWVSEAAMNALEEHSDSADIKRRISERRAYRISENNYREERRNRAHKKQSVLTESKERGSKKTLDNVRNMLKKPINGGKWL